MKLIAIDYSPAQSSPAGIGQYSINLTKYLLKNDHQNKYLIFSIKPITDFPLPENVQNIVIPYAKHFPAKGLRYMRKLVKIVKQEKADILLSLSNHALALMFKRTYLFIHDLAPLHYPQYFPISARIIYPRSAKLGAQKALKVITISNTVKEDIITTFKIPGSKVEVIYPSLNSQLFEQKNETKLDFELPQTFLFSVSTLEPRKNYIGAIKALKLLENTHPDLHYLISGKKGWYYEQIYSLIKKLHLESKVHLLGYRSDAEVAAIFPKASGFLYLSHYEGFGMPPLEAIKYDIPLLLSDIKVFRECFNGYARFVPADDIKKIAEGMAALLEKPQLKINGAKLLDKFSWDKSALKLISIMNNNDQ